MDVKINEAGGTSKKKMIAFELPELWYQALKEGADEELLTVSNLIRIVLYKNYIEARLNSRKEL